MRQRQNHGTYTHRLPCKHKIHSLDGSQWHMALWQRPMASDHSRHNSRVWSPRNQVQESATEPKPWQTHKWTHCEHRSHKTGQDTDIRGSIPNLDAVLWQSDKWQNLHGRCNKDHVETNAKQKTSRGHYCSHQNSKKRRTHKDGPPHLVCRPQEEVQGPPGRLDETTTPLPKSN